MNLNYYYFHKAVAIDYSGMSNYKRLLSLNICFFYVKRTIKSFNQYKSEILSDHLDYFWMKIIKLYDKT